MHVSSGQGKYDQMTGTIRPSCSSKWFEIMTIHVYTTSHSYLNETEWQCVLSFHQRPFWSLCCRWRWPMQSRQPLFCSKTKQKTLTPWWMRSDSNTQKSLNHKGEVIIVQSVSKVLLCLANWDSEFKTNFNPRTIMSPGVATNSESALKKKRCVCVCVCVYIYIYIYIYI